MAPRRETKFGLSLSFLLQLQQYVHSLQIFLLGIVAE
jgi:hypothetical protein